MKDSQNYLDHINGKKRNHVICIIHLLIESLDQRLLGTSLRPERATVEQVHSHSNYSIMFLPLHSYSNCH